jgi:hypothetical protein
VKKLLLLVAVAAAGYVLWTRYAAERDDRDLWAEVTDPVE